MGDTIREFVAEDCWLLIAIVTVVLVSLVGLAGLEALAGAISILGFILLTPIFLFWGEEIAELLFDDPDSRAETGDPELDALEELKRRYAAGEIDDDEFDRRLERLLAVDDLPDEVFGSGSATTGPADSDQRERDLEREWE